MSHVKSNLRSSLIIKKGSRGEKAMPPDAEQIPERLQSDAYKFSSLSDDVKKLRLQSSEM
jgi:hypothetical protein